MAEMRVHRALAQAGVASRRAAEKLVAEGPGILAWIVRGWRDYREKGGLAPPEIVLQGTRDYRQEEDVIGRFLAEKCEAEPDSRAKVGDVQEAFIEWCRQEGMSHYGKMKRLSETIKSVYESERNRYGTFYLGLRLKQEDISVT